MIEGTKSQLIEVGHKGMYVVVVGLYKNGQPSFRYQRCRSIRGSKTRRRCRRCMVDYQRDLETLGLEGLGLKPSAHPTARQVCRLRSRAPIATRRPPKCISRRRTPTPRETLVHLDPPRHFDPECLSCHVTGWEPQKYFPFVSGYSGLKETPDMVGNGCENCHGPAARHVAAENGDIEVDDAELEQLRAALRLKIVDERRQQGGPGVRQGQGRADVHAVPRPGQQPRIRLPDSTGRR